MGACEHCEFSVSKRNKSLCLSDEDPYDYARAIRVFKETTNVQILSLKYTAAQNNTGELSVDITDRYGNRPVQMSLNNKGEITIYDGTQSRGSKNIRTPIHGMNFI